MRPPRSFKKLCMLAVAIWLSPIACKQKGKRDTIVPEVSFEKSDALVTEGSSSQASFSPKGDKLLFVSARRKGHQQAQIYEKDLSTGEETRITFQNGDTSHPSYHPKEGVILYSSSTDELKENPPLLNPAAAPSPLPPAFQQPVEVYQHSLNGLEIVRLTDAPGFDGEARFTPDGQTILFTRARKNKIETVSLNRKTRAARALPKLGDNPALYSLSPDNKWRAWVDWDASFGVARLKVQKGNAAAIEVTADQVVPKMDLQFSPDSKWLFWSQFNPATQTHQLWSLELETACARKLNDGKDDRRHPALSPDLKRLVYTSTSKVQSRIMQAGFIAPAGPCAGAN